MERYVKLVEDRESDPNPVHEEAVKALKTELRGEVVLPSDKGYEENRKVWNGVCGYGGAGTQN